MAAWHNDADFDLAGEQKRRYRRSFRRLRDRRTCPLLGRPMALGRTFGPEEDQVGANRVAVLSWSTVPAALCGRSFNHKQAETMSWTAHPIRDHRRAAPRALIYVLTRRTQLWVPYASTFDAISFARHDMHQSHVVDHAAWNQRDGRGRRSRRTAISAPSTSCRGTGCGRSASTAHPG